MSSLEILLAPYRDELLHGAVDVDAMRREFASLLSDEGDLFEMCDGREEAEQHVGVRRSAISQAITDLLARETPGRLSDVTSAILSAADRIPPQQGLTREQCRRVLGEFRIRIILRRAKRFLEQHRGDITLLRELRVTASREKIGMGHEDVVLAEYIERELEKLRGGGQTG